MTVPWLVACDLDQTLIYSRRAFRTEAGEADPAVLVVEYLDGKPLSYATEEAAAGLRELALLAPVVPVTTRTLAQYRRIDLGFSPAYAIAANGGHLLVNGIPDPSWEARVRSLLASSGQPLADVRLLADQVAAEGEPWVRTIRDADGLFLYLVATDRAAIPKLLELSTSLESIGWTMSVQGRKVYLVPAALTKQAALAEVMRRTGAERLAAAGDSLLDLGMLRSADFAVRPAHGELHAQAVTFPQLTVARRPGVMGGEEIVGILRKVVARTGDSRNADVTFRVSAG